MLFSLSMVSFLVVIAHYNVKMLGFSLTNRLTALTQRYENNTEDRIIRPNREGDNAGKMQVIHIDTCIPFFCY
jgi:hypothetical protein